MSRTGRSRLPRSASATLWPAYRHARDADFPPCPLLAAIGNRPPADGRATYHRQKQKETLCVWHAASERSPARHTSTERGARATMRIAGKKEIDAALMAMKTRYERERERHAHHSCLRKIRGCDPQSVPHSHTNHEENRIVLLVLDQPTLPQGVFQLHEAGSGGLKEGGAIRRRRRWSSAENLRIVRHGLRPGASVSRAVRHHEVMSGIDCV